jgi:hypothetical protein
LDTVFLGSSFTIGEHSSAEFCTADVLHRASSEDILSVCAYEGEIERFEPGTEGTEYGHEGARVGGHDAEDCVVALEVFQ